jgi:RNA polymerase sigma-70 factor (ECF subfamily)
MARMVEERILAALDRGDHEGAAAEVIRGYGPQILGYLTRVLGSPDDAQDAFSLFAESTWRGIAGFQRRSTVRVWAYRVAWTTALRVTGDAWRRRRERLPTSLASRIAADVLSRTARTAERESAALERLRRELSAEEHSLLVLRVDRRLAWREVAEVMAAEGRPVDEEALRKRFGRLREKLARLAREAGMVE